MTATPVVLHDAREPVLLPCRVCKNCSGAPITLRQRIPRGQGFLPLTSPSQNSNPKQQRGFFLSMASYLPSPAI